jgi:hypothetical protein
MWHFEVLGPAEHVPQIKIVDVVAGDQIGVGSAHKVGPRTQQVAFSLKTSHLKWGKHKISIK